MAYRRDAEDWLMIAGGILMGLVIAAVAGLFLLWAASNVMTYNQRSTQNGVTCIVSRSELTNTVVETKCPKPFTNSK